MRIDWHFVRYEKRLILTRHRLLLSAVHYRPVSLPVVTQSWEEAIRVLPSILVNIITPDNTME
jgi:hypothetical protein